jgi:RNA polymerase sigma-70 factor (ECF subfamily)
MADLTKIIKDCGSKDRGAQHALYKHLAPKSFKGDGPIEAWARRITINTILEDFKKKNVLKKTIDINSIANTSAVENNTGGELTHEEVLNFINNLPEAKKIVFNLYVMEGYSHREISQMLDISEGTSKSQLSRAKEMLAEIHKRYNAVI